MGQTNKWDEAESIQIIRSMIESTRYQLYADRFLYFMWGYASLLCAMAHYLLAYILGYKHPYIVWLIMPLLGIVHFIFIWKRMKTSKVATFPGRVMQGVWGGMFMGIIALLIGASQIGWMVVYPCFMLFYGVACFATGSAIQFKYLVWGGVASVILGAISFFQPFQYQLVLLMLTIFVSYILPAHLMKPTEN
jgi:hypothetical protein